MMAVDAVASPGNPGSEIRGQPVPAVLTRQTDFKPSSE